VANPTRPAAPGQPGAGTHAHAKIAAEWSKAAPALAAWVDKHIVNQRRSYGHYKAMEARTGPKDTAYTDKSGLTLATLHRHFQAPSRGDLIGLHSTFRDEAGKCWSRWLGIDIDLHEAGDPEANRRFALQLYAVALALGFPPLLLDSNGRGGFHLILVFAFPVATERVYAFGQWLIRGWKDAGLTKEPETFPKQATIKSNGFGNWLRLFGRHHTHDHWARLWNGQRWLEGTDAIKGILATKPTAGDKIPVEAFTEKAAKQTPRGPKPSNDLGRDAELAREALEFIPNHDVEYDDWLTIGMALRGLGEDGRQLFHEWSSASGKYDFATTERKYASLTADGGVALGTLFHKAKVSGWSGPGRSRTATRRQAPQRNGPPSGPIIAPAELPEGIRPLTDYGNAERLVGKYRENIRYCKPWNSWLIYDGRRWARDEVGQVDRHAKATARQILAEAAQVDDKDERKAVVRWALASESRKNLEAMIVLARSEEAIPVLPDALDGDPWLFNCQNGTLDLRTGKLRPHRRDDYITAICPVAYDPRAECPLWESTLELVFDGNIDLIAYWRSLCGCVLTGDVSEQILPILFGTGENGKSTILNALLGVMGPDYAKKAPQNFLMVKRHESHPTELADLFGKRLVVAIETNEGARINEVLMKELTGSDPITARRMRENFWTFNPTHKLMLCTNHKPVIRGTDHALWRRIHLIPFGVKIPAETRDKRIASKLAAEAPGILAWCVRGCRAWQQSNGLEAPQEVREATEAYRNDQNAIGRFLAECCIVNREVSQIRAKSSALYAAYCKWAEDGHEYTVTQKAFSEKLLEMGFEKKQIDTMWYLGIGLRA
jgi:putative DNA primase/helicase